MEGENEKKDSVCMACECPCEEHKVHNHPIRAQEDGDEDIS